MTSLYIHVPFCKQKCNYCDFVSYAGKEDLIDEYVNKIIAEIHCWEFDVGNLKLKTIFFGGGTPTLLEPKHFDQIISTSVRYLALGIRHSEISIESNPGTADLAKLKALRQLGINRLSIGVQSFNNKHLKTLGRIHTAEQAVRFYHDARAAGFYNINLDLMFALPDQTLEEWNKDLQTAINLQPNHLSTYNLQIEEGTPFALRVTHYALPSEDTELAMYKSTIETLTKAGYKHYEISNFAKPGYECRHNINYWRNGNWIGVGAGAHSHVNGRRWANPALIEDYVKSVTVTKPVSFLGNGNGRIPTDVTDTGIVTDKRETIFLGLRLLDGLEAERFTGFEKEAAELIADGLLMKDENNYRLTRRGLYLGNLVFERFV